MPILPSLGNLGGSILTSLGGRSAVQNAALKTGLGLGGGLLASKIAGGGPNANEKSVLDAQLAAMRQGSSVAAGLYPQGSEMFQLAGQSFRPAADYWSKLLSGDRGQATSALAPQLNQMSDQYSAQRSAASELMPRGGGRASMLQNLPYQQQREAQALYQTVRPQAAQGLLQVGQGAAGAGSSLLGNATQAMYGSTSAGRNILDYESQRRTEDRALGSSIGKSIFDMMKGLEPGAKTGPMGLQPGDPRFTGPVNQASPAPNSPQPGDENFNGPVNATNQVIDLPGSIGTIAGLGTAGLQAAGLFGGAASAPIGLTSVSIPELGIFGGGLGGVGAGAGAAGATGAGAGAGAAGAGAAGAGGAGAGGGLGASLGALATNPITIGAAAAIAGLIAWKKSQVHPTADKWVQGFQNPFDQNMRTLSQEFSRLATSGQLSAGQAQHIRAAAADAIQHYQTTLQQFAGKGSHERTVAAQAQQTFNQYYPNLLANMDTTIQQLGGGGGAR